MGSQSGADKANRCSPQADECSRLAIPYHGIIFNAAGHACSSLGPLRRSERRKSIQPSGARSAATRAPAGSSHHRRLLPPAAQRPIERHDVIGDLHVGLHRLLALRHQRPLRVQHLDENCQPVRALIRAKYNVNFADRTLFASRSRAVRSVR